MKLITTVVRPERLPEVKTALFRAGITGITLSRVTRIRLDSKPRS